LRIRSRVRPIHTLNGKAIEEGKSRNVPNCIRPINLVRISSKFIARATNFGKQIYGCIESKRIGEREKRIGEEINAPRASGSATRDVTRNGEEAIKKGEIKNARAVGRATRDATTG
jgi:hypothetical protein